MAQRDGRRGRWKDQRWRSHLIGRHPCGGADASASLASVGGTRANVTLPGIAVSNGKCQIGASTTAGTLTLDDFVLVKN